MECMPAKIVVASRPSLVKGDAQHVGRECHNQRPHKEEDAVKSNCQASAVIQHEGSTNERAKYGSKLGCPNHDFCEDF